MCDEEEEEEVVVVVVVVVVEEDDEVEGVLCVWSSRATGRDGSLALRGVEVHLDHRMDT
jgi:hypothetical protein